MTNMVKALKEKVGNMQDQMESHREMETIERIQKKC